MIEAPDYVEPLEAWRVWRVVRREDEFALGSIVQRTVWPAGEALAAECLRRRPLRRLRRRPPHDAPEARCDCGIYAARLECVSEYIADAPSRGIARVLGRVALWGTVVECERGFRASLAYPARIYVPVDAGDPWRISWEEVARALALRRADRGARLARRRRDPPARRPAGSLRGIRAPERADRSEGRPGRVVSIAPWPRLRSRP